MIISVTVGKQIPTTVTQ